MKGVHFAVVLIAAIPQEARGNMTNKLCSERKRRSFRCARCVTATWAPHHTREAGRGIRVIFQQPRGPRDDCNINGRERRRSSGRTSEATATVSASAWSTAAALPSPTAIGVRGEAAAGVNRLPGAAARAECAGGGTARALPDLLGEADDEEEAAKRGGFATAKEQLTLSSICICNIIRDSDLEEPSELRSVMKSDDSEWAVCPGRLSGLSVASPLFNFTASLFSSTFIFSFLCEGKRDLFSLFFILVGTIHTGGF